jgi:Tfp pilus assembly protein PilV
MRSALQAATANEKSHSERETEVTDLKSKVAEMDANKEQSKVLEEKIASLEAEIAIVCRLVPDCARTDTAAQSQASRYHRLSRCREETSWIPAHYSRAFGRECRAQGEVRVPRGRNYSAQRGTFSLRSSTGS